MYRSVLADGAAVKNPPQNSQGREFGFLPLQISQVSVNSCVEKLSCVLFSFVFVLF